MDPMTCRLCGAPLTGDPGMSGGHPPSPGRCPNCGLYPVGDLDRRGYGRLVAGLAGVYLLTALLVLLTRTR